MRGWRLSLIGLVFIFAGCCAHEDPAPPSVDPQSSASECPTGECCEIKSRATMLKKSLQAKESKAIDK
jgi:hypothetical protein